MKKTLFLAAAAIMSLGSAMFASTNASDAESASTATYPTSPQVCQFSLSSYNGKINGNKTQNFTVGLSCPQEKDVYATVVVYIEGKLVASEVVKVPAKSTKSSSVTIRVDASYSGKEYELGVQ